MPDEDDIRARFRYYAPNTDSKAEAHEHVRNACGALAHQLNDLVPEGREKALAMTKIEEAMFWANAALARSPWLKGNVENKPAPTDKAWLNTEQLTTSTR